MSLAEPDPLRQLAALSDQQADIQQRLEFVEQRNTRVEAEKAWEASWYRRLLIMAFTYLIVFTYNAAIGVKAPWFTAVVPTTGFLLSTLTFRWIKRRWIGRRGSNR